MTDINDLRDPHYEKFSGSFAFAFLFNRESPFMNKPFLFLAAVLFLSAGSFTLPYAHALGRVTFDSTGVDTEISIEVLREAYYDSLRGIYDAMGLGEYGLDFDVFRLAMTGYYNLRRKGVLSEKRLLTVIDYTRPSTEKRFYLLDLHEKTVMFHSLVAHGRNTGENFAYNFSDIPRSKMSSLGFFVTAESYMGGNGYSLRLDGLDEHWNGNSRQRAIVVHGAPYVSEDFVRRYGRLGRSFGCPALPNDIARSVIDEIKGGTLIFSYFSETKYLASSPYLQEDDLLRDELAPMLMAGEAVCGD